LASSRNWAIGLPCSQRHRDRHLLDALAREPHRLEDDFRTFGRRRIAPLPQALLGRRERVVEIGTRRMRHHAEHAFVGRVEHRLPIRALPFPVDEELQHRIRRHNGAPSRFSSVVSSGRSVALYDRIVGRGSHLGAAAADSAIKGLDAIGQERTRPTVFM
jgi:hypothetical protein